MENESLLKIIYGMMQFTKEEISALTKVRHNLSEEKLKKDTKKGILGMFAKWTFPNEHCRMNN